MEDGRRLENLSWRLWNRETFCCSSRPRTRSSSPSAPIRSTASSTCTRSIAPSASDDSVPALSSSLDSASSHDDDENDAHEDEEVTARGDLPTRIRKARPDLRRKELPSDRRSRGREKHITPDALASIVTSIKNTKSLEPIDFAIPTPSPKPADKSFPSFSQELADLEISPPAIALPPATPETAATNQSMTASHTATLESSASTFDDKTSQSVSSDSSSNTEMSTHSVVRGFVPGGAPSSYRSQTNLAAQPTPILKTSPSKVESEKPTKKKGPMFTIGTSSGEDESSFESHMHRSSLSESLKRSRDGGLRKGMSYREEMARAAEQSPVFETDEEDEDVSESAIEDDDDSSDWEDSDDQSRPSSVNEKEMHFQRVDSRPEMTSRRSVLTSLLHEPDRAKALANAASRSSPAIRRSRTATPNGPSLASSPDAAQQQPHHHHHHHNPPAQGPTSSQTNLNAPTPAQPISRTQSGALPIQLALSPRTTRRNMLSTELTESLRKNLLWERQHRSTGNLAAMNRRRHTSTDVKNLRQMPEPGPVLNADVNGVMRNFNNDYFNQGLQEYHAKGW